MYSNSLSPLYCSVFHLRFRGIQKFHLFFAKFHRKATGNTILKVSVPPNDPFRRFRDLKKVENHCFIEIFPFVYLFSLSLLSMLLSMFHSFYFLSHFVSFSLILSLSLFLSFSLSFFRLSNFCRLKSSDMTCIGSFGKKYFSK